MKKNVSAKYLKKFWHAVVLKGQYVVGVFVFLFVFFFNESF